MIEITEDWYGQGEDSSSHSKLWDNSNHTEKGYIRTLGHILISFKRTDYESIIFFDVRNGNIDIHSVYVDKEKKCQPHFYLT